MLKHNYKLLSLLFAGILAVTPAMCSQIQVETKEETVTEPVFEVTSR